MSGPLVTAAVPTLGMSPLLGACVESLRAQQPPVEVVVVCPRRDALPTGLRAGRVVETGAPAGFAAATNTGWRGSNAPWLLAVNDDAVLEPGWLSALLANAGENLRLASLQGVNLAKDGARVDGCGLAWNRWLQAVQIDHGNTPPPEHAPVREIYGVSATAALYRRSAVAAVALRDGAIFDERFESYYEDVDLAVRLRTAGYRALLVPAARARHAGGATGGRRPLRRARLLTGNRLLTLRRGLGRGLWRELPLVAARDGLEAWRQLRGGRFPTAAGMACGWARALWRAGSLAAPPARTTAATLREWPA